MAQDIKLYNSFTKQVEDFAPADPSRVTIYCCGPTVYAAPHIGNARAAVTADLVQRVMRHAYGEGSVIFARNYTDIDDKIINAATERGVPMSEVTEEATRLYEEGLAALGNEVPDSTPRATAFIDEMQAMISTLITRGHAYGAEGHILFSTESFSDYGGLSGCSRDQILEGARVEVAPYKRDASDFVLWKPSADDVPGWEAPEDWPITGRGRPGWHIECSAMIEAVLGSPIDIHLGGADLRFPHHENEIAQSCCAGDLGGVPLARHWMHNGMLRFSGEKMSKSLGNIQTPQDLLEDWPGEVLRLALLSAQYRQPLDWSDDLLRQTKAQLDRFYRVLGDAPDPENLEDVPVDDAFWSALKDDFNTPQAIAALHAVRERGDAAMLRKSGQVIGLFSMSASDWFQGDGTNTDGLKAEEIEDAIRRRQDARANKDFATADAVRDELLANGIVLEDGPDGVTWRRQ